jgi:hypothetical protein
MTRYVERCKDCGIDTTPCTGKRGCRHKGRWEHYMVHDVVWAAARMKVEFLDHSGFLCVGCIEKRLHRKLTPADFPQYPINETCPWDTERLASRKRGEQA